MTVRKGPVIRFVRIGIGTLGITLLPACAHMYVDAEGARHVVGFVSLTLPPADAQAGEALRSRSLGLSLTRSEAGSAVVIGYSDTTLAFVRNHSLVPARALLLGRYNIEETIDDPNR